MSNFRVLKNIILLQRLKLTSNSNLQIITNVRPIYRVKQVPGFFLKTLSSYFIIPGRKYITTQWILNLTFSKIQYKNLFFDKTRLTFLTTYLGWHLSGQIGLQFFIFTKLLTYGQNPRSI